MKVCNAKYCSTIAMCTTVLHSHSTVDTDVVYSPGISPTFPRSFLTVRAFRAYVEVSKR